MRASGSALAAALLLAACGGQDGNRGNAAEGKAGEAGAGNAVRADPGAAGPAGAGARSLQPGQWEMQSRVTAAEMPGASPQVQAQARAQLGRTQTDRTCITPEEAADPARNLIGGGQRNQNCQFSDSTFAGGVIRLRALCRQPGGPGQVQVSMEGGFTATTLNASLTVNATSPARPGQAGAQTVRASSTIQGRRVGDCPPAPARRGTR